MVDFGSECVQIKVKSPLTFRPVLFVRSIYTYVNFLMQHEPSIYTHNVLTGSSGQLMLAG
jgi:hypothetical protein